MKRGSELHRKILPVDMEVNSLNSEANSEIRTPIKTGAVKHDKDKVPLELLSFIALIETAKVMAFGAQKYEEHNWRKGFRWARVGGAALRHIFAWMMGENKDPESGLSHLAHAMCCIMFLLEFELTGNGEDNRFKIVDSMCK